MKKFNIPHVDLLKMDCKGCEFFLNEKSLKNVDRVKIEYAAVDPTHKIENLLKTLKDSGFEYFIYRTDPNNRQSNKNAASVYGIKKSLKSGSQE